MPARCKPQALSQTHCTYGTKLRQSLSCFSSQLSQAAVTGNNFVTCGQHRSRRADSTRSFLRARA